MSSPLQLVPNDPSNAPVSTSTVQSSSNTTKWSFPTDFTCAQEQYNLFSASAPHASLSSVEVLTNTSHCLTLADLIWWWTERIPSAYMTISHCLDPGDAATSGGVPKEVYPIQESAEVNGRAPLGTGRLSKLRNVLLESPTLTCKITWLAAANAIARCSLNLTSSRLWPEDGDKDLSSFATTPKVLIAYQHSHPHFDLVHLSTSHAGAASVPIVIPTFRGTADQMANDGDDGTAHLPSLKMILGVIAIADPIMIVTSSSAAKCIKVLMTKPALAGRWGRLRPDDVVATDDPSAEAASSPWNLLNCQEEKALKDLDTPRVAKFNDLALIQFTSGSTSFPKGVAITHGNQMGQCIAGTRIFGIKSLQDLTGDEAEYLMTRAGTVIWQPAYHDMGLQIRACSWWSGRMVVNLAASLFLQRPMMWLRALSIYGANNTGAPNFALGMLRRKAIEPLETYRMSRPDSADWPMSRVFEAAEVSLEDLRCLCVAAEPTDIVEVMKTRRALEAAGLSPTAITHAYGLAESVAGHCVNPLGLDVASVEAAPAMMTVEDSLIPYRDQIVALSASELSREIVHVVARGGSAVVRSIESGVGTIGLAAVGSPACDLGPTYEDAPMWILDIESDQVPLPVSRSIAKIVQLGSIRYKVMLKSLENSLPAKFSEHAFYNALTSGGVASILPHALDEELADLKDLVHIVGVIGREATPGMLGEVWLQSTGAASGYYTSTSDDAVADSLISANGKTFRGYLLGDESDYESNDGPYLCSGDSGFVHGNQLFICGRVKEMITWNGRNYWGQDIENVARRCLATIEGAEAHTRPAVMAALQLGAPDVNLGRPPIVLMLEMSGSWMSKVSGPTPNPEAAAVLDRAALILRMAIGMEFNGLFVDTVVWVKRIERTTSAKIRRAPMQAEFLNQAGASALYVFSNQSVHPLAPLVSQPVDRAMFRRIADDIKAAILRIKGEEVRQALYRDDSFPFMEGGMDSLMAGAFVSILNASSLIPGEVTMLMVRNHPSVELLAEYLCREALA